MKQKKIYPILILAILTSLLIISCFPMAAAESHIVLNIATYSGTVSLGGGGIYGRGASFQGDDSYLDAVTFYIWRSGVVTGTLTARLYETTSLTSTDSNLNPIATSLTGFDASTLSETSGSQVSFDFNSTVLMSVGHYYAIVVQISAGYSGTVTVGYWTAGSNIGDYTAASGAYTDISVTATNQMTQVIVIGNSASSVTPTPVPTATPTQRPGNYWDNYADDTGNTGITWMDNTLPYFIPLILIMVCAFLGWYFAKTWGFMAGLNLGVIFAYVIFPLIFPVWGVLAVIIVDGLLIYSKVGRGSSE